MERDRNGADHLNHGSAAVTMTRNVRVRDMHSVFQLLELVMGRGTAPLMDPRNPYSGTCLVAITKSPNPSGLKLCIVNGENILLNTQNDIEIDLLGRRVFRLMKRAWGGKDDSDWHCCCL